jgi:hypothetical protein
LFAARFELNQRACTQSALPWRPVLVVVLRVGAFTARTLAQVAREGKVTAPHAAGPRLPRARVPRARLGRRPGNIRVVADGGYGDDRARFTVVRNRRGCESARSTGAPARRSTTRSPSRTRRAHAISARERFSRLVFRLNRRAGCARKRAPFASKRPHRAARAHAGIQFCDRAPRNSQASLLLNAPRQPTRR